jgi:competence protein ComEC
MHVTVQACQPLTAEKLRPIVRAKQPFTPYHRVIGLLFLLATVQTGSAAAPVYPVFLTFFDVGQGDALLIHQPGQCAVLIDAGPPGSGRDIGVSLRKKGISRLDRLIISHPHQDHFGGVLSLPDKLAINEVNDNGVDNDTEPDYAPYRSWRREYPYRPLHKGDSWRCGSILFTVLGPKKIPAASRSGINDSSLVLHLEIGPISLLLPGDLEAAGWQSLGARTEQLDATIFTVPHHGAEGRHLQHWLAEISPELSVISVGKDHNINNTDLEALAASTQPRGKIWRTDRQGSLEISIDEHGWRNVGQ